MLDQLTIDKILAGFEASPNAMHQCSILRPKWFCEYGIAWPLVDHLAVVVRGDVIGADGKPRDCTYGVPTLLLLKEITASLNAAADTPEEAQASAALLDEMEADGV